MLIQLKDGKPSGHPVDPGNFRTLFPNTSFPSTLAPYDLEGYGYGVYEYTPKPEVSRYQKVTEAAPIQDVSGVWRQTWEIEPMSESEIVDANSKQANDIRVQRNIRLTSSDWTQLPDAPVDSAAWATYRQELRDITSQAGFPWEVVWPVEP